MINVYLFLALFTFANLIAFINIVFAPTTVISATN